mgnify:CR=1 FL=1
MNMRAVPDWLTEWEYAHRGLHTPGVPENSLAAAKAAIGAGMGIECDIQMSADGVPIVFHDWELSRLTSVEGMVGARDLRIALVNREALPLLQVRDIARGNVRTVDRDLSLDQALDLAFRLVAMLLECGLQFRITGDCDFRSLWHPSQSGRLYFSASPNAGQLPISAMRYLPYILQRCP